MPFWFSQLSPQAVAAMPRKKLKKEASSAVAMEEVISEEDMEASVEADWEVVQEVISEVDMEASLNIINILNYKK